ncbi:MAG TPA: acetate/propionate family kinase [Chthoniobacterales bacterium]
MRRYSCVHAVATLNVGSGSQQFSVFTFDDADLERGVARNPVWEGRIDATAPHQPPGELILAIRRGDRRDELRVPRDASLAEKVQQLIEAAWHAEAGALKGADGLDVMGHRVVHGGEAFATAVAIDPEVEKEIERLGAFAPLHNPPQLEAIRTGRSCCPWALPVAVFDTAFHRTLLPEAYVYPGPWSWREQGIRRFGFHGSSFRYVYRRAADLLGQSANPDFRVVICHLGGGCSLAAVRGGKSLDTTMGFTPLDGIPMCTRSGALDPGILLFLLRGGASVDELEQTLNKHSGLKGLSGLPGDTRILLPQAAEGHQGASIAIEVFIHRLRQGIGAMVATLGGVDALVFTDAIGESEPSIRARACEAFAYCGVRIDPVRNQKSVLDSIISADESAVAVLVVKTREDWQVATEAYAVYEKKSQR